MKFLIGILTILLAVSLVGCESEKEAVTADELPIIKKDLHQIELLLADKEGGFPDSLLSTEAKSAGIDVASLLRYVYPNSDLQFVGFTKKQIFYRSTAARIDCMLLYQTEDSLLSNRPTTITLKKENGLWRLKNIEERIVDSTRVKAVLDSLISSDSLQ